MRRRSRRRRSRRQRWGCSVATDRGEDAVLLIIITQLADREFIVPVVKATLWRVGQVGMEEYYEGTVP